MANRQTITHHPAPSIPPAPEAAWPGVDIVVVNYNTGRYIADCIRSLQSSEYANFTITVVDNASSDGSGQLVQGRFGNVRFISSDTNLGFGGGCNIGMQAGTNPLVATVNPDARVRPSWLREAVRPFLPSMGINPDALPSHLQPARLNGKLPTRVGIVGSKILYTDRKTIQHAGGNLTYPIAHAWHTGYGELDNGQYDVSRPSDFVTGAAMVMRRDMMTELGWFDASLYPVYFEDVDLCFRAWAAGWQVRYEPRAVALHYESVTMDRRSVQYYRYFERNRLRFVLKHYTHRQLFDDFVPAETARLSQELPDNHRRALNEIYGLNLQATAPIPPNGPTETLQTGKLGQPPSPAPTLPQGGGGESKSQDRREGESKSQDGRVEVPLPDSYAELKAKLENLKSKWLVQERPFASRVPGVAWLRQRIVNLASRWYVQPILAQQVEYNAALVQTIEMLTKQLQELQATSAIRETLIAARLGAMDTRLEATIARSLARLAAMDATIKQMGNMRDLLSRE